MNALKKSKFLCLVLRHAPEKAKLTLDKHGWADVAAVLPGCRMSMSDLDLVVETDNKKRFEFNEDKTKIRASQGHSLDVDLGYEPKAPPDILYHGTVCKNIFIIARNGLNRMDRHHVHLSSDVETAINVGSRRGSPAVFIVNARKMYADGYEFFLSTNGVWLTDHVPEEYLCLKKHLTR